MGLTEFDLQVGRWGAHRGEKRVNCIKGGQGRFHKGDDL